MDKIKLQLNSAPLIKQLIDENPEFELEIKKTILDSIVGKHIKDMTTSELIRNIVYDTVRDIKTNGLDLGDDTKFNGFDYYSYPSTRDLSMQIREHYRKLIKTFVYEELTDMIKADLKKDIKEIAEQTVNNYIKRDLVHDIKRNILSNISKMLENEQKA